MRPILILLVAITCCVPAAAQDDLPEIFREDAAQSINAIGDESDPQVKEGLRYLYQRIQDLEKTSITKAEATEIIKAEVKAEVERVRLTFTKADGEVGETEAVVTQPGKAAGFRLPDGSRLTHIDGVPVEKMRHLLSQRYGSGTYASGGGWEVVHTNQPVRNSAPLHQRQLRPTNSGWFDGGLRGSIRRVGDGGGFSTCGPGGCN